MCWLRACGLLLGFCAAPTLGLRPLPCSAAKQLFITYDGLRETLEHFLSFYGGYSHGRPKVVAEHVKLFQLQALAQDFMEIIDAFRLFTCLAICPEACAEPNEDVSESFEKVRLVEKLNNLQLDIELLVGDAGADFVLASQAYLREAKSFAASLLADVPVSGSGGIDWDEAQTMCVARVASRVIFPAMQVLSLDSKNNESQIILSGVSLDRTDPASLSGSYISPPVSSTQESGELAFSMLNSLATSGRGLKLSAGPGGRMSNTGRLCAPALSPFLAGDGDSATEAGWPRRWRLPPWGSAAVPYVVQLLELIEASRMDLSHTFVALRPSGDGGWAQNFSCTGKDAHYDPSLCLEVRGYGAYVYSINIHPPYRGELRMAGRRLGDVSQASPSTFYDVIGHYKNRDLQIVSIEHVFHSIDFIWRQTPEPSPDLFFLHPATHNCHAIEYLFTGAPLKPKVLVVPINPLVPPPFEVMPRFETWWHLLRPVWRTSKLARGWVLHGEDLSADSEDSLDTALDGYLTTSFWLGQCSLAAIDLLMERMKKKKFRYVLHHVDRAYAVYVRLDVHRELSKARKNEGPEQATASFSSWLRGWHCSPEGRFFSRLELVAGADMRKLADPTVPKIEKEKALCHFLDRHNIPVQRRNFDCEVHLAGFGQQTTFAETSCVRPDVRGWGNDAFASESIQDSAGGCEAHCSAQSCTYWTFDPTSMYGRPLCWIWVGGRPGEIKSERGWISGDADCQREQAQTSQQPSAKEPEGTSVAEVDEDVPASDGDHQIASSSSSAGGSSRELFKQWAVRQLKEVPGMRYFLESGRRGRCVRDFCECFPPYRGPLCEQLDTGMKDGERNFSGVLHYLTSDDDVDIEDIQQSLPRLWRRFNRRFDYPVVIFNDGLSEAHRKAIVDASRNRIWFAYVDDYLQVPEFLTEDPSRKAALDEVKWSMGYRGMCRFRSGTIFLQPVLRNFEYAMTLDTDGYFPAPVTEDPIAAMHAGGYVYTWSHLLPDLPGAVRHFWEYSLMYMRMKNIEPRGTPILRQFVREDDIQWNYQLYMNDIEIVQLEWFRSDPYQDYFRYLDSMGGFWLHRWGDHAVRTIAVGMWLPEDKVFEMDVPYGHQNYCRCSGAHPHLSCVREADVGGVPENWWICAGEETKENDA